MYILFGHCFTIEESTSWLLYCTSWMVFQMFSVCIMGMVFFPPFFPFLLQWHVNSMLWFFQNFHWVMFWKKNVDSYHTLRKVFQWLLHFLQPDLVFLVDCKTASGNTSFAHNISLIPGTFLFRSFLLPFCCSM